MYDRIKQHGENVKKIFGLTKDPVALSKTLRRLEAKASKITTDYANGTIDSDKVDPMLNKIKAQLNTILHFKAKGIPVIINQDPRGYALKIDDGYVNSHQLKIHRDFGGYGILAPDLTSGD